MKKDKISGKIILGIDPGTNILGYGVIECIGNKIQLQSMGVVRLEKYKDPYIKLQKIFERITVLIEQYLPDEAAIEAPFYGKNVQSMLKLGRAQGVSIAALGMKQIPVSEYAPKKIKQSITGSGNASKEQVAAMLKTIVPHDKDPSFLDATDALAVAVCHNFQGKTGNSSSKGHKSWSDYIAKNPNRVK